MATARRVGTNEVVWTMGASGRDYTSAVTWEADWDIDITTGIEQSSISSVSATRFDPLEALTFTGSGATGICYGTSLDRTLIYYVVTGGTPASSDAISGDVSGATATLDSVDDTNTGTTQWLEVYNDATHNMSVDISGATTTASFFRGIRSAIGEKHTGIPNTGARFVATDAVTWCIRLRENFAAVYDMELSIQNNSGTNGVAASIHTSGLTGTLSYIGCIVDSPSNAGAGEFRT